MTTIAQEYILNTATQIAEDHPGHDGLNLTIDTETLAFMLDLEEWALIFATDNDATTELAEEVADIIRQWGEVTTRLEAEVEREGEKYLMTWIPENVSRAHNNRNQWSIAFADEDNPPYDGQIHQETGYRQVIASMTRVENLEDLQQGFYHLQPLNND